MKLKENINSIELFRFRTHLDKTVLEMAELMGVSESTYYSWESFSNGRSLTPVIQKFLRVLNEIEGTETGEKFDI